ncbi:MAG: PIN domain-containing protein [Chitinophagales bacterium]
MERSYVIDAKILFSALISGKVFYQQLFRKYQLYAPEFILRELAIYNHTIQTKSKIHASELRKLSRKLFSELIILPDLTLTLDSLNSAKAICDNIDSKDIAYVALAIELDSILLTRDKKLHDGLKKQEFNNEMLFDEFVRTAMSDE